MPSRPIADRPAARTAALGATPADLPDADQADQGGTPGSYRRVGPHRRGSLRCRRGSDRRAEVGEITAARERGEMIWPVIDYADIEAGTVPAGTQDRLRRRGCLVVRGHFDREQALSWDRDIVDYVESNGFFENYRGPGDDFFGSVGSRPEIYPIYWSPAQMQARQSDRMARVQAFLNSRGSTSPAACSGSTPAGTRCTRTASAAARPAPTPAASAATSTPATSTCG